MKLLDDLFYVLNRRDCDKCEFKMMCEVGFVDADEKVEEYTFCDILKIAKIYTSER